MKFEQGITIATNRVVNRCHENADFDWFTRKCLDRFADCDWGDIREPEVIRINKLCVLGYMNAPIYGMYGIPRMFQKLCPTRHDWLLICRENADDGLRTVVMFSSEM